MLSPRDLDHYTDAVLIAVLRLVVARGEFARTEVGWPHDSVLTSEGIEALAEAMRLGQALRVLEGDGSPRGLAAAESYRVYRDTVDPLWRYVTLHGLDELRRETDRRLSLL